MKQKESLDDELRGLSPLLRELKRGDDGAKVPPGYFDTFESDLFEKIEQRGIRRQTPMQATGGRVHRSVFMNVRMWAAIAATLTLLLTAWWFFRPGNAASDISSGQIARQLSDEEVENYVLENIQEFEAEQLAVLPDNEQLPVTNQPPSLKPNKRKAAVPEIAPEDLDNVLKDMSDEELEQLL